MVFGQGFRSSWKKASQSINSSSRDLRIIDLEKNIEREPYNSAYLNRLIEVRLRLKKLAIANKKKVASQRFRFFQKEARSINNSFINCNLVERYQTCYQDRISAKMTETQRLAMINRGR